MSDIDRDECVRYAGLNLNMDDFAGRMEDGCALSDESEDLHGESLDKIPCDGSTACPASITFLNKKIILHVNTRAIFPDRRSGIVLTLKDRASVTVPVGFVRLHQMDNTLDLSEVLDVLDEFDKNPNPRLIHLPAGAIKKNEEALKLGFFRITVLHKDLGLRTGQELLAPWSHYPSYDLVFVRPQERRESLRPEPGHRIDWPGDRMNRQQTLVFTGGAQAAAGAGARPEPQAEGRADFAQTLQQELRTTLMTSQQ